MDKSSTHSSLRKLPLLYSVLFHIDVFPILQFRLSNDYPVYIKKSEIFNLPKINPLQKLSLNGQRNSKETTVNIRSMVKLLINLTVPVNMQKHITAKNIPDVIFKAIKCKNLYCHLFSAIMKKQYIEKLIVNMIFNYSLHKYAGR